MFCRFQDSAGPFGAVAAYATEDRVLRVEGCGARGWLDSLLTADLRSAAPAVARYALLLSPKGGIVSDAWALDRGVEERDGLALVLPQSRAEAVYALLCKYILNEDVTFEFDESVRVLTLVGPQAGAVARGLGAAYPTYSCDRLGVGGIDVWVPASQIDSVLAGCLATALGPDAGGVLDARAWSAWRVTLGVPTVGVDFDEDASPHEAGLDSRAVSFEKGCYLGKELVARQQRRGGLSRRLVQLEVDGAEALSQGVIVRDPSGADVGRITSAAPARSEQRSVVALAYVLPSFAEPGAQVVSAERSARVRRLVGRGDSATAQAV